MNWQIGSVNRGDIMQIAKNICCGLDTGTSSLGWALLDTANRAIPPHTISETLWRDGRKQRVDDERFAAGVIKFEPVESRQKGKWISRSADRGAFRRARKTIQRKQWRLDEIVRLFHKHGLIVTTNLDELFHSKGQAQPRPIDLRARALREVLNGEELFRACYHIAAHRNFEANSKAGEEAEIAAIGDNAENDDSDKPKRKSRKKSEKAAAFGDGLKSLTSDIEKSGLTPAEYFQQSFAKQQGESDPRYRGSLGRYDRIFKRRLLESEVEQIFEAQRRLGNDSAGEDLQERFAHYAFYVKEGQDSEKFVGPCSFACDEDGKPLPRAPRFAPSYERYRFVGKLATIRLADGEFPSAEQKQQALARFGEHDQFTWKQLAEIWGLEPEGAFKDAPKDLGKDVVNGRGSCARGTARLLDVFTGMNPSDDHLDLMARKLTHLPDIKSIEKALRREVDEGNLPHALTERAIEQARAGTFKFFKGTGNVSIRAARLLTEQMVSGKNFADACKTFDWRHEAPENDPFVKLDKQRPTLSDGSKGAIDAKTILALLNSKDNPPVASPGAHKALVQAFKHFVEITKEFALLPERVHVELSRQIGKSLEEKRKMSNGRDENEARNNRLAKHFESLVGRPPFPGSEDLLRYRLWLEQQCRCPYKTNRKGAAAGHIDCKTFIADRNGDGTILNIDHILPWSWSKDDSYENKVLCFASENARKADRTPYQYFAANAPGRWEDFKNWVDHVPALKKRGDKANDLNPGMGGYKRRNLLVEDGEALDRLKERLPKRHLNDNCYAARILSQAIELLYPVEKQKDPRTGKEVEIRHVFARPGQLVGTMRRAWGLNPWKFDGDGKREDERNHAVDALVIAAISERQLQQLTDAYKQQESEGGREGRALSAMPPPWPTFAKDVKAARDKVFVVRNERKRARGAIHKAGIFGGGPTDEKPGEPFTQRLRIDKDFGFERGKFSRKKALQHLRQLKDRNRNRKVRASLLRWLREGAPREEGKLPTIDRPSEKTGEFEQVAIKRIMLANHSRNPGFAVHDGDATRDTMIRVDLFQLEPVKNKVRWEGVPIYLHQVLDRSGYPVPPDVKTKSPTVGGAFAFSLQRGDYVELVESESKDRVDSTIHSPREGDPVGGYYINFDKDGKIGIRSHEKSKDVDTVKRRYKQILTIKKYSVDRFGRKNLVEREKRTWHGEVCTSPIQPG